MKSNMSIVQASKSSKITKGVVGVVKKKLIKVTKNNSSITICCGLQLQNGMTMFGGTKTRKA